MKEFKNNHYVAFTIDMYALKPLSLEYKTIDINQSIIGCRKIKFRDLKKDKINAGCDLKITYLGDRPIGYTRVLSLKYIVINKVYYLLKTRSKHIKSISYYKKRGVNDYS